MLRCPVGRQKKTFNAVNEYNERLNKDRRYAYVTEKLQKAVVVQLHSLRNVLLCGIFRFPPTTRVLHFYTYHTYLLFRSGLV